MTMFRIAFQRSSSAAVALGNQHFGTNVLTYLASRPLCSALSSSSFEQPLSHFSSCQNIGNQGAIPQRRELHTSAIRRLADSSGSGQGSWLSNLLTVRKIEPGKESHSRLLSDSDIVYQLDMHNVIPGHMSNYQAAYNTYATQMQQYFASNIPRQEYESSTESPEDKPVELVASWRAEVGDEDQVVNIWRYRGGFKTASTVQSTLLHGNASDPTAQELVRLYDGEIVKNLRSRNSQFCLAFSFWGHPKIPSPSSAKPLMYEMRSYVLKPGTMIEWGNNWARGITYRKEHAVGGFFSQIGQLYVVHHVWKYENLATRKQIREDAWRKPGWDECVAYTVPLIKEMTSRWMSPFPYSPLR